MVLKFKPTKQLTLHIKSSPSFIIIKYKFYIIDFILCHIVYITYMNAIYVHRYADVYE